MNANRAAVSPSSLPTPTLAAPKGRRLDHLLCALVGLGLTVILLALAEATTHFSYRGNIALALLHLVLFAVFGFSAQTFFAARSSVGGLVTGLSALLVQLIWFLAPAARSWALLSWAKVLAPTGIIFILSATMLGGAWAMRIARRGGRASARLAADLAPTDRLVGHTPPPPPSRRTDHCASLLVLLIVLPGALYVLHRIAPVFSGAPASLLQKFTLVVVFAALILSLSITGRSSLGARSVGALLCLAGLPLFLGSNLAHPSTWLAFLSLDPRGISVLSTGLLVMASGWGAHLARQKAHAAQLQMLR